MAQGRTRAAAVLLDKAIEAYLAGFGADCRDHYPGINAVQLMHLRDPTDTRIAEILPVVRYSARQKELRHHADFWDHATLLELAVLEENADDAWTAVTHAIYARPLPWQARDTLDNLVLLRRAREQAGDPFPEGHRKSRPNSRGLQATPRYKSSLVLSGDCQIFRLWHKRGGAGGSAEQDSLAQQGEAGPSVHLSLQELELGVGALDRAVAVGQAQSGDHGVEVFAEPADEGVQREQVAAFDGGDPVLEVGAAAGGEQVGEGADVLGEDGEGRAAGQQLVEVAAVMVGQLGGPGHDPPDEAPRRR